MTATALPPDRRSQLLLPGQAAAPEGPVDLTLMWVMHHGFRRDLAAFSSAAATTPVADRATWRALADRWRLFATLLHHHHSGEDAGLWPLLLAKVDAAGDANARRTLEAMAAEHAGIDPLLESCAADFRVLAARGDDDVRDHLAGTLVAAREHLGRHLAHEERDAMAILQAHLEQADWDRVGKEHFEPAYSAREMLAAIAWVMHGLPSDGLERMRQQPKGGALLAIWRLFLRRRFERRERRTFRSA